MKKLVKISIVSVLVLVSVVIIGLMFAGQIIKTTGAQIASDALGVPVTIGNVSIDYFEQSIRFSNLKIGSPEGFKAPYMLNFSDILIDAESIFSKPMIVDTISIGEYDAYFEMVGGKNNFAALSKSNKAASTKSQSTSSGGSSELPMVINLLDVASGEIHSSLALMEGVESGEMTLPVPAIKIKNLGSKEKPTSATVVVSRLINNLTSSISKQNPAKLLSVGKEQVKNVLEGAEGEAKRALDSIGGMFK